MLGKKLINPGAVACTTDTTQILDGGTTQSTALYRFEDNANDTASGTGKFNKGGIFNGSSSRIDLPTGDLGLGTNNFSVSLWFNSADITQNDQSLYWFQHYQSPIRFGGSISASSYGGDNNIRFYCQIGSTGYQAYTNSNIINGNTWYHAVLVKSSVSGMIVYINGSSVATNSSATGDCTNTVTSGGTNTIGAYQTAASSGYFNGSIDQFRTFNKVLSTSEITTLYNETTTTANTLQVLGDTSCISTYTFEGNANDLNTSTPKNGTASNVIYDYSGTVSGATYVTGKFGKAASFDGTNDYISADNPNASGGARSFSAWIKTTSTGFQSIITNGGASHASGLNMFVYNNKLYSTSGKGNGENYGPTSSANINTGDWVHCVLTMSGTAIGSTLKTYVNGSLDGTHTTTVLITDTYDAFRIGGRYINGSYVSAWFNGQIDQVRIFNTELSPGEVNSLYNETTTTAALGTISNPSTVAYYKMQDATDETGSYNQTASTVNFNVKGKYGFAAEFNGSSSYMSFPAPYSHTSNEDNITVSWWMNGDTAFSSGSFWTILGGEIGNTSGYAGTININAYGKGTNQVYISLTRIWGSSARYHASGSTSSSDWVTMIPGQWYHNVLTYDPATNSSKYYVDGTLIYNITFTTYTTSGNVTNGTLAWGKYRNGVHYFNGKIDQARFFNKVISADEVTKLYNEIQCANPIATPENYFNSVLYTGNATARSIGVGFQPDFTWIKSRTNTNGHRLYDSVRGATKGLSSDGTYAEYTESGLTSFDINGFSTGSHDGINQNSQNFVAWNWKSGGILNQSASFNGSSSVITINSSFDFSSSFSISMWFNADALPSSTYVPLFFTDGYGGSNSDYGVALYLYGNTIKPWIDRQATYTNIFTAGTLYTGTWYHVVLNRDYNSKWELFLNGSSLGTYTSAGLTDDYTPSSFSTIGKHANSAMWFDGRIDQTRIFNKALSSSEVTTLYNETSSTINTLQVLSDTSCIAAYPLGIDANDLDTSTPQNGTASNVVFDNPGHLTRNNNGTIESAVSASPESGFSIVKYTGNDTVGATVGHGLSSKPQLIFFKALTRVNNWGVYAEPITADKFLVLNESDAESDATGPFNDTEPTSSIITLGNSLSYNNAGTMIAYCFHSVAGYQRIGSYVGNSSTNGPFIYTGFEPAFILVKGVTSSYSSHWMMIDNKRDTDKVKNKRVLANLSNAESADTNWSTEFHSNGFQPKSTFSGYNHSSGTYIFMAIAANPDTTAPTKANSFKTKIYTGTGSTHAITGLGFKPDFIWTKNRDQSDSSALVDSVRGIVSPAPYFASDSTDANATSTNMATSVQADGYTITGNGGRTNTSSEDYVSWNWKGSDHDRNLATINNDGSVSSIVSANPEAGFSIVQYTGPGVFNQFGIGHGLSSAPQLIIQKSLTSSSAHNYVLTNAIDGSGDYLKLDTNDAKTDITGSATSLFRFDPKTFTDWWSSAQTVINYCFHSVAGYSSIGTYTGNGSTTGPSVTVGFRPSWIITKNASNTGSWYIWDAVRAGSTTAFSKLLYGNITNVEYDTTGTAYDGMVMNITDTTFEVDFSSAWTALNTSGNTYLYMAFK